MVSLDPRQKGLFVCARLPSAVNDMALDERARQDGLILKALSPYYASHRRNSGLLLGYSGYAPAQLLNGVRALARLVEPSVGNLAAGR
jgi:GntR family transcriptional regulator/MocR family aminotransferase